MHGNSSHFQTSELVAGNYSTSITMSDSDAENDEVGLSAETLRALREFALDRGVFVEDDVVAAVREHCEVKDREDVFKISYNAKDGSRSANFELKGIKKELGQTLDSTGLTM
jgi:hypothetical protein